MADPVLTSAVLNKGAYAKGETVIATLVGSDPDEEVLEVTFSLRSKTSGAVSAPKTVTATVDELEAVATGNRTWTFVSRAGDTFTLSTTA